MRIAACLAVSASLMGCAVVPPQAWSYDPTQPRARIVLPAEDAVALSERVAQLQTQRVEIRSRIAMERDAMKRQSLYADLHAVGVQLSPLERTLAAASSAR
jgi:hypothetical protein